MSCCLGISLQRQLNPQTYELARSQIQDFIAQTNYKIIPHNHLLIISNGIQKYCIPNNPNYLYSSLQHLTITSNIDQDFIEVIIQSLMILKQYFPNKIQIEMISELPLIYNMKNKVLQEIPRRLISRIKALQSIKKQLNLQDVQALIHHLDSNVHKNYEYKLKSISIKVLAQSKINAKIWQNLSNKQIQIINTISNNPLYQKTAIQLLQKIVRNKQYQNLQHIFNKQNILSNQFENNLHPFQSKPHFDGPLDTMTALFQLRQSINIQRLSWIINSIDCSKLNSKKLQKFDSKIKSTAEKFVNGGYSNYTVNQAKNFGRALSEYEMKRYNLGWKQLLQNVLIKIQEQSKNKAKYI